MMILHHIHSHSKGLRSGRLPAVYVRPALTSRLTRTNERGGAKTCQPASFAGAVAAAGQAPEEEGGGW